MGSKSSTAIKVCGITLLDQAEAIAKMGTDALGVIGVKSSPRCTSASRRRGIFSQVSKISPKIERVWVVSDLSDKEIEIGLTGKGLPTVVQLHGNESHKRCNELRNRFPTIQWWKAIQIRTPSDIAKARSYEDVVDALLLDSWSKGQLGGTGERIPLEWLHEARFETKWWLAGGISAESIPEVLSQISPFGIDASSRLERSPGIKDLNLVNSLLNNIKGMSI